MIYSSECLVIGGSGAGSYDIEREKSCDDSIFCMYIHDDRITIAKAEEWDISTFIAHLAAGDVWKLVSWFFEVEAPHEVALEVKRIKECCASCLSVIVLIGLIICRVSPTMSVLCYLS